jgi:hypothetical protein
MHGLEVSGAVRHIYIYICRSAAKWRTILVSEERSVIVFYELWVVLYDRISVFTINKDKSVQHHKSKKFSKKQ